MLSAAELASMQATAQASLDQTAQVQRAAVSVSAFGHAVQTWNTVIASLPVRVATPSTPTYAQIAARLGVELVWRVMFAVTADVRGGDRLIIGTDTLTVHSVAEPQSYNTLQEAVCSELR